MSTRVNHHKATPALAKALSDLSMAVSQTSSDDRGLWGSMKAPVSVGDKKDRGVADIAAGDVAGGPVGGDVGTQSSEDLNK